jgi:hypothetical protein
MDPFACNRIRFSPSQGANPVASASCGRDHCASFRYFIIALSSLLFLTSHGASIPASAQLSQWRAERDLRIGSLNDPGTALSQVGALAVAEDGTMYVAQPTERTIRVFDANGRPLRRIGRRGVGPGEFQGIVSLGIIDGVLHAFDPVLNRVSFFALPDGEIRRTVRVQSGPLREGHRPAIAVGVLRDGPFVAQPPVDAMRMAGGNVTIPVLQLHENGRTLGEFPPLGVRYGTRRLDVNGGVLIFNPPVSDADLFSVAPDGSAVVYVRRPVPTAPATATYTVSRLRSPRDTVWVREHRFQPQRITARSAAALRAEIVRNLVGPGITRREAETIAARPDLIPGFYPPVSALVAGQDCMTWLLMEGADASTTTWLVLDEAGVPVGIMPLPRSTRVLAAGRTHLWGVERDELDVEYVVRYRIRRR